MCIQKLINFQSARWLSCWSTRLERRMSHGADELFAFSTSSGAEPIGIQKPLTPGGSVSGDGMSTTEASIDAMEVDMVNATLSCFERLSKTLSAFWVALCVFCSADVNKSVALYASPYR